MVSVCICAVVRTLRLCEWMQWLIRCEDECHVNVPDFSATLCGQKSMKMYENSHEEPTEMR